MIRFVMFLFLLSAFTVHAAGLVSYPSLDGDIEKCSAKTNQFARNDCAENLFERVTADFTREMRRSLNYNELAAVAEQCTLKLQHVLWTPRGSEFHAYCQMNVLRDYMNMLLPLDPEAKLPAEIVDSDMVACYQSGSRTARNKCAYGVLDAAQQDVRMTFRVTGLDNPFAETAKACEEFIGPAANTSHANEFIDYCMAGVFRVAIAKKVGMDLGIEMPHFVTEPDTIKCMRAGDALAAEQCASALFTKTAQEHEPKIKRALTSEDHIKMRESCASSLGELQQHAYGNALNFLCRTSIVRRVEREQLDQ